MSKQQLAAIFEMSAQNPIPANAAPAVMRAWGEDVFSHLPVAENVQIERVNCGPCDGDLILAAGGDASRFIIFHHGGGFFFGSSRSIASSLPTWRAQRGAPYWCQTTVWLRKIRLRPPTMMHPPCISGRAEAGSCVRQSGFECGFRGRQSGSGHGRTRQGSLASAAWCADVGVPLAGFGQRRRLASGNAR